MCNAYNLRHREAAILDIARHLELAELPEILATDAARRWVEPGPRPQELLAPYPAEPMQAWTISDAARNSRIETGAAMAEPVRYVSARD